MPIMLESFNYQWKQDDPKARGLEGEILEFKTFETEKGWGWIGIIMNDDNRKIWHCEAYGKEEDFLCEDVESEQEGKRKVLNVL